MGENKKQNDGEEAGGSGSVYNSAQRKEYFDKLERWLVEAYAWHSFVVALPYIAATSQALHAAAPVSNIGATLANANISSNQQQQTTNSQNQRANYTPAPTVNTTAAAGFQEVNGITYRIPPIWKRFVAELIDSMLLLVLKLSLTFIAVDVFDFIDIEKYYLDILQTNLRIDYKMALELTSGILILELIHRIFVCAFEAFWLQYGRNGRVGGATPGKSVMRLKVVRCRNVAPVGRPDDELVLVTPGTDLGLIPALGRSVLKNLILAFFFPTCFALCFFRFNRTGYDLVCHSIVVEDSYVIANVNINNNNNNNNNNLNNNNNNNQRVHQD